MLVAGFVIVVQAADAGFFLVLDDLLFQNFQFKFHEVNLLLQVGDVLALGVLNVRVRAHQAFVFFVLAVELHFDCRFVVALQLS